MLFEKLFNIGKSKTEKNNLRIVFIKEENEWRVLSKKNQILYIGTKELCDTYVQNSKIHAEHLI